MAKIRRLKTTEEVVEMMKRPMTTIVSYYEVSIPSFSSEEYIREKAAEIAQIMNSTVTVDSVEKTNGKETGRKRVFRVHPGQARFEE